MKNILLFFSFYVRVLWKNRKAATILWLSPIFFLLLLMVIVSQLMKADSFIERFDVAIVNEDPTIETRIVISQLTDSPHLQKVMKTRFIEKEQMNVLFNDNEIAAAILIPEGFSKDVAKGINTPVTVVKNPNKPLQSQLIGYVIESAADFTSAAQSGINTVSHYMEEESFTKKEKKDEFKQDLTSFSLHILGRGNIFDETEQEHLFNRHMVFYYAVSAFVLLIMIWSFLALQLFKKQINSSVLLRLNSYGVSPFQSLIARGMAAFLLVFISVLLLIYPVMVWLEVIMPDAITNVMISAAVSSFVFISLFLLLEILLVKENIYLLIVSMVMLLSGLFGEHFIPAIYFPGWMQKLNEFTINGVLFQTVMSFLSEGPVMENMRILTYLVGFSLMNMALIKIASVNWRRRFL